MLPLLAAVFVAVFPAVPPASAGDVVKKVQAYYAGTQKLRADFRQDYTNTTFGRTSQSDGRMWVQKPGKMRWDYAKPEKKYFISDGTTLWVYEEAAHQAIQQSLKDQILPVAVTFLYGQGDLATEFNAELDPGKYGGKDAVCVKLTPKKADAQYKNLWLVVDPTDFHVSESIIREASDNINHFTFFNIKQNAQAKVEDRHFTFVPPTGVKVVKPDQPGGAGTTE
jgi:outer membrane lipoprotein carrier protein